MPRPAPRDSVEMTYFHLQNRVEIVPSSSSSTPVFRGASPPPRQQVKDEAGPPPPTVRGATGLEPAAPAGDGERVGRGLAHVVQVAHVPRGAVADVVAPRTAGAAVGGAALVVDVAL